MFFKKREHQNKGALKQKIEASLYTLYWGFKEIPFILYTYVLTKILKNGAESIQNLTPGFKNHMRTMDNFRQVYTGKSKKLKFDVLLFPKNKFVQKIHFFS